MRGLRLGIAVSSETNPRVLDIIREKNSGLQDWLEVSFDLPRMLSSPISYRALLQAYLGIYRSLEGEIARLHPDLVHHESQH